MVVAGVGCRDAGGKSDMVSRECENARDATISSGDCCRGGITAI
jgi:hypothetical protein